MSTWLASPDKRPRVLIAGSGVAALEACLLLRDHVTADDVEIELLTPAQHFTYRPLSVLEPVGGPRTWSMPLVRFASDQDAEVVHDELSRSTPTGGRSRRPRVSSAATTCCWWRSAPGRSRTCRAR